MRRRQLVALTATLLATLAVCAVALASRDDGDGGPSQSRTPTAHDDRLAAPASRAPAGHHAPAPRPTANRRPSAATASVRLVPTAIRAEPRGREVIVSAVDRSCSEQGAKLRRVAVRELASRLVLTAYVTDPPPAKGWCPEIERVLIKRITLAEPNGSRPIYDGSRKPPRQVWPRR